MKWPRVGGILAHPTSLPGPFGIGDLGSSATHLLDFLVAGHQKVWQVLPLGPTGYGNSPYQTLSAFAGNPLLISPERLVEDDLLPASILDAPPAFPCERVDYGAVAPWKMELLRSAFACFQERASGPLRDAYKAFCAAERGWLGDYALFTALKEAHGGAAWVEWEQPYAQREPQALDEARARLAGEIAFATFTQFTFFRQWRAVRAAARTQHISILGDLAIFVAHDSADVWAHPEFFSLDEQGRPTVVAGVPPDYFSPTGQLWGNPLYRWDVLKETGYAWWIERVRHALALEDFIRLDHFRGFHAYWEVPGHADTALGGRWVPGPGAALFAAIHQALGDVPLIAEDLGQITAGVNALRSRLGFPGMRVLQFAFGSNAKNPHLPHNFSPDIIVYTGTHDNDTTRGWLAATTSHERAHLLRYLNAADEEEQVVWELIQLAFASVASLAVVPLQDVLELGSEARMNYPSQPSGNWEWRCTAEQLSPERSKRLASLAALYGR